MAGTKEIKRRIKSVKNTKKITKAMELVAASKMKRAVSNTLASRLYANYSHELLTSFAVSLENNKHPFLNKREELKNKVLYILITSNRGLCGGYNAQAIKKICYSPCGNDLIIMSSKQIKVLDSCSFAIKRIIS